MTNSDGAVDVARDPRLRTPWELGESDIVAALNTDPAAGLTSDEARRRLAAFGSNQLRAAPPRSRWLQLLDQFRDPLTGLLAVAVIVSFAAWWSEGATGVPFDGLVIAAIIVANGVLGYVQQARAEQAVAALRRMAAPVAMVTRDGVARLVEAENVVPGDIVVLSEGDAVPADGRLLEASALKILEASLTGESEPAVKTVGAVLGPASIGDRTNMVFAGTAVATGRARVVITATGMTTEMGAIAQMLATAEDQPTPLEGEVSLIGRTLAVAVVAIALIVVVAVLLTSELSSGSDYVDVLLVGVSLAVAAVPEGLPAVLSVVLALGVQRMARERAIVKRLAAVETLGCASVICSDKTGTLTRNEMTVGVLVTPSAIVSLSGVGYVPEGVASVDGRQLGEGDEPLLDDLRTMLGVGVLASNAELVQSAGGDWSAQGDPTEAAIVVAAAKLGVNAASQPEYSRIAEIPFSSERKLMSTVQRDLTRDGAFLVATKGAPDLVLQRCVSERVGGKIEALAPARREEILASIDALADQALRPLAIASRELDADIDLDRSDVGGLENVESGLVYLGMVGIFDPPRAEAAAAIRDAQRAGIRVIMITGDHPRTALRIAADLRLVASDEPVLTGLELDQLSDLELRDAVRRVSVYARVAPVHKLRIVAALQSLGNVVAMTGDGVNDAPALRAADIGVAMGRTGTDVTREAGDMILADDNFATIVAAVRQGRAIFANIRTFLRFLLSSNAGEILTMFLGVVAATLLGLDAAGEAVAVPLLATQILWINLLTDTAPALALGVDPPAGDVMSRPPRRRSDRVIDAEMWSGILLVGLVMAAVSLLALDLRLPGGIVGDAGNIDHARTMAFTTLVLAQLYNCLNARSDRASALPGAFRNRLLWLAIGVSVVLQVAVVHAPVMNDAFRTVPLSLQDWAICAALASAVVWVDELRKLVMRVWLRRPPGKGARQLVAP